jgi:hypothetical protein
LTDFWVKEARIRFCATVADMARGVVAQAAHNYTEINEESKKAILKMVSRERAIINLLRLEQGTRTFIKFLSEVEDQEHLCRTKEQTLTSSDMQWMSLIAGMKDRSLAEKFFAEEYTLTQVIQEGVNRESSKANMEAMQARPHGNVHRVEDRDNQGGDLDAKINHLQEELKEVMRVRKSGKYSGRFSQDNSKGDKCKKYTYEHGEGRCPVDGRRCNVCGGEGHFAKSLCSGQKPSRRETTNRRVEEVGRQDEDLTSHRGGGEQSQQGGGQ